MSATYFSNVAARPARERHIIRPGVVRMVNNSGILVAGRAGAMRFELLPSVL